MQELVLYDGTRICTQTGARLLTEEQQQHEQEAEETLSTEPTLRNFREGPVKRQLSDVPVDFPQFRVLMCISACAAWGLDQNSIARVLGVERDDITDLMASDDYKALTEELMQSLASAYSQTTEGILMASAPEAAFQLKRQLGIKDNDARRMAAKDILDRTGFKAADIHKHQIEGDEFVIRIIKDEDKNSKVIDL